jgi:general secretion pathway protein A
VLAEIHSLLKRCTIDDRRLHFILVGQRQLARRLLQPELSGLNDAIGARAILDRITRAESFDYIEYWLQSVGGKSRTVFGWRALAHIVEHGGGVPRRLNVLCHNALLLTSSAGHRKVHVGAARQATSEYSANTSRQYRPWFRSATRGQTAALVVPDSNAAPHAGAINRSPSAAQRI